MNRTLNLAVVAISLMILLTFGEGSSPCSPSNFRCVNDKCIAIYKVCDGMYDCEGEEDEDPCYSYHCHPMTFQCLNGKCISRRLFCDSRDDCGDKSDERYCYINSYDPCPHGWARCPSEKRCIPSHWVCDGWPDCDGTNSEETDCEFTAAKSELMSWFLRRRRSGSRPDRWGSEIHRIAVALYLADDSIFMPGNSTGEEILYELTMQLLHRLEKDKMTSQELALYIHALLVSCMDPKDFYGKDLVRELRRRVENSGDYSNPFLFLALCNAGDTMTTRDVNKVLAAYDSQPRPFWTDSRALASMALSCISTRGGVSVDENTLENMLEGLKRRQFRNGTVDNLRTTALVTQALYIHDSYKKEFDLRSALKVLSDGLNGNKSLLDAYYSLPALSRKSLLNVTSGHCRKQLVGEEESLQKVLDVDGEMITVQYSVWMGDDMNGNQTWRLRMRMNSTVYDAIETVAKIDNSQKIKYNIVDSKPYVGALNGKEDDPELGMFWFVFLKTFGSLTEPKIVKESPVDIKLKPNDEIILWYYHGPWSGQSLIPKSVTPP